MKVIVAWLETTVLKMTSKLGLMIEAWSSDAKLLSFAPLLFTRVDSNDKNLSTKVHRELNGLTSEDGRSRDVAAKIVEIAGGSFGFSEADCHNALWGSDHNFFSFLSKYCVGAPKTGDKAGISDVPVHGTTIVARSAEGDNSSGDSHLGNSLAPHVSSGYVGIKWPYPDALGQHFGAAYQEIFGEALPREKTRRGPREQVFFFYRLGLEQVKKVQFGDGAIRINDQNLGLVIRRIPARIHYEEPFDEWLTYEEAYYDKGQNYIYNARGVIYGFRGGMTMLCRDETLSPRDSKVFGKKLALSHVDFRPALHDDQQTSGAHRDTQTSDYYIGSIAMESDFNPNRRDYFAPTAYRCLLRKAPSGTKWDDVKARTKEGPRNSKSGGKAIPIPGKSATIPLGSHRRSDGIFDLKDGRAWNREENDLQYGAAPSSWRWYFNRLNINRHLSDLLIACPSVYSRWPSDTDAAAPTAITEEPQPSHNAGPRRRDKRRETTQE